MPKPIPIRMSSAGKCPRLQYYAAHETPESNPPDRQSENRMALGDAAETILINNMVKDGWEITDTRAVPDGEQIELEIDQPLPMTGHPDGICRHPEHTRGKWVTLECKSMSTEQLQRVRRHGIARIYPDYLAQVTCYARVLYEQGRVSHPHRAVFTYMDRDGDNPAPERVSWETDHEDELWHSLTLNWQRITSGQIPERPYAPDDTNCQLCPYYTLCQGQNPPESWQRPATTYEPEVIEAGEVWLDADLKRRQSREILMQACPDPYEPGLIAGPVRASWFWPKESDTYDPAILERLVPQEVLRQCLNAKAKGPAFWIRDSNR